jgi:hypothetical protein
MRVTAKVTLDPSKVAILDQIKRQAIEMTAEAVLTDIRTSAVVPKDTGELERSGFVDTTELQRDIARIVFDTPYARRLYWHPEYNFRTDRNPNARGKWMEPYHTPGQKREWVIETFEKFVRMLMRQRGLIR